MRTGTHKLGRACQMPWCGDTEDNRGQRRPSIVVVGSGVREEWGWTLDHRARTLSRHAKWKYIIMYPLPL